ncbi:P-loop containing nucleoside triphosphate hydrolase protein [Desarmillaria tabescens]|uniref:P-loop containing nucleoside triphosphate hydrolase protein n=1 Tax=Armillaria tabescens TaxID=1929756 RepID=A0AA39NHU7_ARMTA|nr:P-loop containing nucleoside triphosphate hydrolase protein [Desarmillaria tabescens]KAK0465925.1 P-loop containing nucleoside triphosphate hydrolase protein [Desarmillaria tabescens]
MNDLCAEKSFGPASPCRHMDLTLGFQFRFMSILPASIFIFCGVFRAASLARSPEVTRRAIDLLSAVKLLLGTILVATLAVTLAYVPRDDWGKWATAGYALELVAVICLIAVSYLHHTRCFAPSTLIGLYLFLSVLFAAAQLRTYATASSLHAKYFAPFVVSFAVRTCYLVAELAQKRRFLRETDKPTALETTSSLLSRLFFVYLYPLLLGGFKRAFDLDDLVAFGLPPILSGVPACAALTKALPRSKDAARIPIFIPSMRAFLSQFLAPVVPKCILIATTFTQPFLVESMLSFVDSYSDSNGARDDPAHGWGLVGAYAIVYLAIASSTALYWDKVYTMVVRYRAALVGVIFDKSMRLSASVAERSVDVERVCEGIAFFHELWSAFISIAVAAVILWFKASFAMIPPIVIMVGFFVITSRIGNHVAKAQKRWMGSTQDRLKVLTSVMSQIIPVKLLAVEPTMPKWIEPVRIREIGYLKTFYARLVIVGVLSSATINFAGIAALGTFVGIKSEDLYPETLFTILTVVNLVTLPISTVGNCFPLLLASYASMKRIAGFLSLPEKTSFIEQGISTDSNFTDDEKSDLKHQCDISLSTYNPSRVTLSHATIAAGKDGKALISDCNVSFDINSVSMVVGPVGAGKSILLKTLLEETYFIEGASSSVLPQGRIAYAPQEAFVWPTTVRGNIVLDNEFNPQWYEAVVDACALRPDLVRMANGDMTEITPGSVSGGQRQRVSLARAVYAKCDVTLLDDCFSALDSHTAVSVFARLLGEDGLLRGKGKLVVLVTHNFTVQHLASADHIVILDSGAVVAEGSLSELHDRDLDVAQYIGQKKEEEDEDVEVQEEAKPSNVPTKEEETKKPSQAAEKKVDEEEKGVRGSTSWPTYKFYMKACGWDRLALCLTCLVIYTAMQIGLQILLKQWSESNTTSHGPWLGGYAAFAVTCFLTSFMTMWMYTQLTVPRASLIIHAQQLSAVLAAPVTYFQRTPLAKLQNRWSSDMFIADFAFPRALQDFTFTAVYVVGAVVLILIAVPWLAISIPVLGAVYWGLQKVYLATSRQLQRLTLSSKTPLYTAFTVTLSGLTTIRAFHSEKLFKDMSIYHLDRSQVPMYYRYAGIRFLRTSLNLLTACVAIAIAGLAVGLRGSTSGGYLGVALSQLVSLAQSLINLLLAYTRVENGIVSVERLFELDGLQSESLPDKKGRQEPGSKWPVFGSIEFRNVGLRYGEGLDPVLHNISFTVQGGEKLGICGRTGSGKSSTVFALLQGLGATGLCTGEIFIDGIDLATVPLETLRSAISTVSQDPFLLYAKMRDNLTLGCSTAVEDEQIWKALELVGMRKLVEGLEGQLDAMVSADGLQFSAGERQLLCIARVLLQKRKIVVLDEASSSMDTSTDQRLLSVLQNNLREATVISVAHRISTIVDYDKVMVLDNGRVVEIGSPKDLLQRPDSLFYVLHKNQVL